MSEEEAIEKAKAKAREMNYSIENHAVGVDVVDGNWKVSFVPSSPTQFGGGLVVLIDQQTGEIVSSRFQQ